MSNPTDKPKSKIVIALGGNALRTEKEGKTAEEQLRIVKGSCKYIGEIIAQGHTVVLVHGNGPQVGEIMKLPVPFDVAGAMSQGYIGYQIQQSLKEELLKKGIEKPVVSLVTQVLVDKDDTAFDNPTKPIGSFFSEEEAQQLSRTKGYTMKEDSGRGWRQVVASPEPKEIVEIDIIKKIHKEAVLITAGGGGIPVIKTAAGSVEGIAAVIDKDLAAELLAEEIGADILLILTGVKGVALNYGKTDEEFLEAMSPSDGEEYMNQGQFAPGSMLPKVKAAIRFAKSKPGRKAIIASLDEALEALEGKKGTVVTV